METMEDVIQTLGDPIQLAADIDSLQALAIGVEGRRSELLSEYPDQWIAVTEDGVIAAAGTKSKLFEALKEQLIDPEDVYHDYLDTNPGKLLL